MGDLFEQISEEVSEKLNSFLCETYKSVEESSFAGKSQLRATARKISLGAYAAFSAEISKLYTTSPKKEVAMMCVNGARPQFTSPNVVQKKIFDMLSSKN